MAKKDNVKSTEVTETHTNEGVVENETVTAESKTKETAKVKPKAKVKVKAVTSEPTLPTVPTIVEVAMEDAIEDKANTDSEKQDENEKADDSEMTDHEKFEAFMKDNGFDTKSELPEGLAGLMGMAEQASKMFGGGAMSGKPMDFKSDNAPDVLKSMMAGLLGGGVRQGETSEQEPTMESFDEAIQNMFGGDDVEGQEPTSDAVTLEGILGGLFAGLTGEPEMPEQEPESQDEDEEDESKGLDIVDVLFGAVPLIGSLIGSLVERKLVQEEEQEQTMAQDSTNERCGDCPACKLNRLNELSYLIGTIDVDLANMVDDRQGFAEEHEALTKEILSRK